MKKKKLTLLFLIFFLTNCGFSPIYLQNTDANFSIETVNFIGDRELNNFLKIKLNQYKKKDSNKEIFIDVKSNYNKIILTKDGAGKITNYQLEVEVVFTVKSTKKIIKINEKKIMQSIADKFDEIENEKNIKRNFASSITNKLISELIVN
jgi:outer membrane lipopolysaccharide assembly protein LptE/RlpB